MKTFLLAVALICPKDDIVAVTEMLMTKPVAFAECDRLADIRRPQFRRKELDKNGCEQDLICVQLYWNHGANPEDDDPNIE